MKAEHQYTLARCTFLSWNQKKTWVESVKRRVWNKKDSNSNQKRLWPRVLHDPISKIHLGPNIRAISIELMPIFREKNWNWPLTMMIKSTMIVSHTPRIPKVRVLIFPNLRKQSVTSIEALKWIDDKERPRPPNLLGRISSRFNC